MGLGLHAKPADFLAAHQFYSKVQGLDMEAITSTPLISCFQVIVDLNVPEAHCSCACNIMGISPLLLQWHFGLHVHSCIIIFDAHNMQREKCVNLKEKRKSKPVTVCASLKRIGIQKSPLKMLSPNSQITFQN